MKRLRLRSTTVFKIVSVFALIFTCFAALSYIYEPRLEDYLVVSMPIDHADALVLMAGEDPARLPAAAKLYKEGKADKILLTNDGIFSAWSEKYQRNLFQVEWAEVRLLEEKIPGNAIVKLAYTSSGTMSDALNTRSYVARNKIRTLLIVTSDYHTRRALWAFERVFKGSKVTMGIYPVKSKLASAPFIERLRIIIIELTKLAYYNCRFSLLGVY